MKFKEPEWVNDFREYIGLEVRLTRISEGDDADRYIYNVISPSGVVLFFVVSYNDSDSIGSTNGPFCSWRKGDKCSRVSVEEWEKFG